MQERKAECSTKAEIKEKNSEGQQNMSEASKDAQVMTAVEH